MAVLDIGGKRMKRKNDNIFMDDVEPATTVDDIKATSA